ncbi:hypothetical protein B7494_g8092 [Chlorociboria aeruginascens]|nr:hypothetical protein B7494_g8092 [Chlorociboria aeruginascens]
MFTRERRWYRIVQVLVGFMESSGHTTLSYLLACGQEDAGGKPHTLRMQYGVLVFRKTNLTDTAHVSFAAQFGELDDIKPYIQAGRKNRLEFDELFDVSNLDSDGSILDPNTRKAQMNRGNNIFHVDSSFNPRRASYSLLRAHALPPPGTGGATEFADTRTAFSTLPPSLQSQLVEKDYIAAHSLWHSRKTASPIILSDLTAETLPMARHKLIQPHEPSGRMNLYLASHIHHLEGLGAVESDELLKGLREHAENPELVLRVEWENEGDLVIWDNTSVMRCFHRFGKDYFASCQGILFSAATGQQPVRNPFPRISIKASESIALGHAKHAACDWDCGAVGAGWTITYANLFSEKLLWEKNDQPSMNVSQNSVLISSVAVF